MPQPPRQYDPAFAQQVNTLAARGLTRDEMVRASLDPDKNDPHDPHAAAMYTLISGGMDPLSANTYWGYQQGAYTNNNGQLEEHKAAIDNPWLKAAVLAPMIAGGGLAAAGALGGGAGVVGSAPQLAAGGDLSGLGGAEAVGAGGGLAGAGEAGGLAGLGTAGTVGPGGGLGAAGDITGELGASTGTATGGVPQALGATSQAATGFGAAGSKWLPTLFNTGMQLGGAALGSHAAGKAAEQQAAQVQNALNLQKDLYGQSRQALMPYYQLGAGSLGRLGAFLGTKPAAAIPDGTLGSLGK